MAVVTNAIPAIGNTRDVGANSIGARVNARDVVANEMAVVAYEPAQRVLAQVGSKCKQCGTC